MLELRHGGNHSLGMVVEVVRWHHRLWVPEGEGHAADLRAQREQGMKDEVVPQCWMALMEKQMTRCPGDFPKK